MRKIILAVAFTAVTTLAQAQDKGLELPVDHYVCNTVADARQAMMLSATDDRAAFMTFARTHPIDCRIMDKGTKVYVMETQPLPNMTLSCLRLTGDLVCSWTELMIPRKR